MDLKDELQKPMDNELENPDYGIDTEVRLRYLQEQILSNKKRAVVEYYRIYLTTLSDFKEILQKEIEQLPEFFTSNSLNYNYVLCFIYTCLMFILKYKHFRD